MTILGIDLGTTNSVAAFINAQGIPTVVPDQLDASTFQTRSVIGFDERHALVGTPALELQHDAAGNEPIRFVKSFMGANYDHLWQDGRGNGWRAEALSALILKKLTQDVGAFTSPELENLVIGVPANFNHRQRQATKVAAALADLPIPTLVDEPIAAAMFLGQENPSDRTIFIYDFGGGTFDATIVQVEGDGLYVLATRGANDLGGRNLDDELLDVLAQDFRRQTGLDPRRDPVAATRLADFAEQTKMALSDPAVLLVEDTLVLAQKVFEASLSRNLLERVAAPAIDRTIEVSQAVLAETGLGWADIDMMVMVGGSSLAPAIEDRLRRESGLPPHKIVSRQPHFAVAYGLAMAAAQNGSRSASGPSLNQQVLTNDIGVLARNASSGDVAFETLLARNTPLPARTQRVLYTTTDGQQEAEISLLQRKSEEDEAQPLGRYVFGPIMDGRRNKPIEISIGCDIEGLVHVSAKDGDSGQPVERIMGADDDVAEAIDTKWFADQKRLIDQALINL